MKSWYTLTIRLATEEPIKQAAIAAQSQAPGLTLAPVLRESLQIEGTLWLDEIYLVPDDVPRPK